MFQTEIDDLDHITRYCKPSVIFQGSSSSDAFLLRATERSLSVKWLEYFGVMSIEKAVQYIREVLLDKGFQAKSTGGFVVFRFGNIKRVTSI